MLSSNENESDVVLIGAGIMSATLGMMLKELEPDLTITILERLNGIANESTDTWNNVETGHSAFCELNYTPLLPNGSIDISKAVLIKKDEEHGGILEFGTELVSSKDGSIAALLGASPGASTSVTIMLALLNQCFPEKQDPKNGKKNILYGPIY